MKSLHKNYHSDLIQNLYCSAEVDLCCSADFVTNPTSNRMYKVNNRNTRTRGEMCWKLIIKTPERCQFRRSGVVVNFDHV